MNDFWFRWSNRTDSAMYWSFLDGGNYFELAPHTHRTEQNQYDMGDRINIAFSNDKRVTLMLTGRGWILEQGDKSVFLLTQDPQNRTVTLACGNFPVN